MIDFCVIGSGFSGSTIAQLLSKKYKVIVVDKGRGPGGRSSVRRFEKKLSFDHGLQYLSPKSKNFKNFLNKLCYKNVVKRWEGTHLDFTFEKKINGEKYIGKKGNNDFIKFQLKNIKQIYCSKVKKINHNKSHWEIKLENNSILKSKGLILTCPYPQLKKLARNYLSKKILNLNINMQPNITVIIGLKSRCDHGISTLKFNDEILSWASNENSKKRFSSNKDLWTLQASIKWSKKNISECKKNKSVLNKLIKKFVQLTGFDEEKIFYKKIHGWRYAYSNKKTNLEGYWNKKSNLGICGDWFLGGKAENAWQSANFVFERIKKNPPRK